MSWIAFSLWALSSETAEPPAEPAPAAEEAIPAQAAPEEAASEEAASEDDAPEDMQELAKPVDPEVLDNRYRNAKGVGISGAVLAPLGFILGNTMQVTSYMLVDSQPGSVTPLAWTGVGLDLGMGTTGIVLQHTGTLLAAKHLRQMGSPVKSTVGWVGMGFAAGSAGVSAARYSLMFTGTQSDTAFWTLAVSQIGLGLLGWSMGLAQQNKNHAAYRRLQKTPAVSSEHEPAEEHGKYFIIVPTVSPRGHVGVFALF